LQSKGNEYWSVDELIYPMIIKAINSFDKIKSYYLLSKILKMSSIDSEYDSFSDLTL